MYILDTKNLKKQFKVYILISIGIFIFGQIYEHFSHQVYSNYMIYAFLIPLIMGACVNLGLFIFNKDNKLNNPRRLENNIYNAAIATLTIGSIVNGVLDIYGTTNSKISVYFIVGIFLILTSLIIYSINIIRN